MDHGGIGNFFFNFKEGVASNWKYLEVPLKIQTETLQTNSKRCKKKENKNILNLVVPHDSQPLQ